MCSLFRLHLAHSNTKSPVISHRAKVGMLCFVYYNTPLADFYLCKLDQRELLLYSGLNREVLFPKSFGYSLAGDFAVGYVDAAL